MTIKALTQVMASSLMGVNTSSVLSAEKQYTDSLHQPGNPVFFDTCNDTCIGRFASMCRPYGDVTDPRVLSLCADLYKLGVLQVLKRFRLDSHVEVKVFSKGYNKLLRQGGTARYILTVICVKCTTLDQCQTNDERKQRLDDMKKSFEAVLENFNIAVDEDKFVYTEMARKKRKEMLHSKSGSDGSPQDLHPVPVLCELFFRDFYISEYHMDMLNNPSDGAPDWKTICGEDVDFTGQWSISNKSLLNPKKLLKQLADGKSVLGAMFENKRYEEKEKWLIASNEIEFPGPVTFGMLLGLELVWWFVFEKHGKKVRFIWDRILTVHEGDNATVKDIFGENGLSCLYKLCQENDLNVGFLSELFGDKGGHGSCTLAHDHVICLYDTCSLCTAVLATTWGANTGEEDTDQPRRVWNMVRARGCETGAAAASRFANTAALVATGVNSVGLSGPLQQSNALLGMMRTLYEQKMGTLEMGTLEMGTPSVSDDNGGSTMLVEEQEALLRVKGENAGDKVLTTDGRILQGEEATAYLKEAGLISGAHAEEYDANDDFVPDSEEECADADPIAEPAAIDTSQTQSQTLEYAAPVSGPASPVAPSALAKDASPSTQESPIMSGLKHQQERGKTPVDDSSATTGTRAKRKQTKTDSEAKPKSKAKSDAKANSDAKAKSADANGTRSGRKRVKSQAEAELGGLDLFGGCQSPKKAPKKSKK